MSKVGKDVLRIPPKTFRRKGKLIHRKGYEIKDVGAPGRGPKVITVTGEMENYSLKAKQNSRHRAILKTLRKHGYISTKGKLWALVQLFKRTKPGYSKTARSDFDWLVKNYGLRAGFPLGK